MQHNPIIDKLEKVYGNYYSYHSIVWQIIKKEFRLKIMPLDNNLCDEINIKKFIDYIKTFINNQASTLNKIPEISEGLIYPHGYDNSILTDFDKKCSGKIAEFVKNCVFIKQKHSYVARKDFSLFSENSEEINSSSSTVENNNHSTTQETTTPYYVEHYGTTFYENNNLVAFSGEHAFFERQ
jgi:hypothetical protein